MRTKADELFKCGQVIVVKGRPAYVVGVEHGTVNYNFIDDKGELGESGWCREWDSDVKHIDFAEAKTVVALPLNWNAVAVEYTKRKREERDKWTEENEDHMPISHPSYGSVAIGRVSGQTRLFGSPFEHMNYISLTISRVHKSRSRSHDRHSSVEGAKLIEIWLSETQWARMISSPGMGEGTPCTLSCVGGEQMAECPEQGDVQQFHADIRKRVSRATLHLQMATKRAKEMFYESRISKTAMAELVKLIEGAEHEMNDGAPFIVKQLAEHMEKVVTDGKTEIEAFAQHTITRLGLREAKNTIEGPQLAPKELTNES